jgi:TetR/AcrR family transcriptional regulator
MARNRADDYDAKRRSILDAAAALFAEHGFGSTSVAMLAECSGGSKAWLYHYYDSKEAVLFDLLSSHVRLLLDSVREADDPQAPPRDRLERLVLALLDAYREADDCHTVQLHDLGRLPVAQQQQIRQVERRIVELFTDAVVAAHPAVGDRTDLRKPVTLSLLGMLSWQHRWFRPDGPLSLGEYARMVVALVLDGLAGVCPPPAASPPRLAAG